MYGREELGRLRLVNQLARGAGKSAPRFVDMAGKGAPESPFLPETLNETLRRSGGLGGGPHDSQGREKIGAACGRFGDNRRIGEGRAVLSPMSTGPVASIPTLFLNLKDRKKGRRAEGSAHRA